MTPNTKYQRISDQQYMYNKLVKQDRAKKDGDDAQSPGKAKQDKAAARDGADDDEYKPEMLASAQYPNNNKVNDVEDIVVEVDQDKLGINQSELSVYQEPEVPPERGGTFPARQLPKNVKNYTTQKNYITDADANTDLLQNEQLDDMINPILYVRGVPSDSFYLILTGKVMICSGNEGFFLEQGAFNYMGVECLTNDAYVPDFSAKIIGKAKLLKIDRVDYKKSVVNVYNQDFTRKNKF